MRLGVIGLGKMGLLHAGIHSALEGAPLTAVCEKEGTILKLARKAIPTMNVYEDYKEMVSSETLDGVIITTPVQSHAGILLDLMKSNRDLSYFVEKPLAASVTESKRICDYSKDGKGVHMVGFQKRYAATFSKAKQIISAGDLGQLQFFKGYVYSSDVTGVGEGWRLKKGGGVVIDLGPHIIDLVIWYFGQPEVIRSATRSLFSQVEDYAHSIMEFQGGLVGQVDICWSIRNYRLPELSLQVQGSNGTLSVNDDVLKISLDDDGKLIPAGNHTLRKAELMPSVPFLLADPEYTLEDQAFRSSVSNKELPESNFYSALKTDQIIEKILHGSKEMA